jgi:hypothetical protein
MTSPMTVCHILSCQVVPRNNGATDRWLHACHALFNTRKIPQVASSLTTPNIHQYRPTALKKYIHIYKYTAQTHLGFAIVWPSNQNFSSGRSGTTVCGRSPGWLECIRWCVSWMIRIVPLHEKKQRCFCFATNEVLSVVSTSPTRNENRPQWKQPLFHGVPQQ